MAARLIEEVGRVQKKEQAGSFGGITPHSVTIEIGTDYPKGTFFVAWWYADRYESLHQTNVVTLNTPEGPAPTYLSRDAGFQFVFDMALYPDPPLNPGDPVPAPGYASDPVASYGHKVFLLNETLRAGSKFTFTTDGSGGTTGAWLRQINVGLIVLAFENMEYIEFPEDLQTDYVQTVPWRFYEYDSPTQDENPRIETLPSGVTETEAALVVEPTEDYPSYTIDVYGATDSPGTISSTPTVYGPQPDTVWRDELIVGAIGVGGRWDPQAKNPEWYPLSDPNYPGEMTPGSGGTQVGGTGEAGGSVAPMEFTIDVEEKPSLIPIFPPEVFGTPYTIHYKRAFCPFYVITNSIDAYNFGGSGTGSSSMAYQSYFASPDDSDVWMDAKKDPAGNVVTTISTEKGGIVRVKQYDEEELATLPDVNLTVPGVYKSITAYHTQFDTKQGLYWVDRYTDELWSGAGDTWFGTGGAMYLGIDNVKNCHCFHDGVFELQYLVWVSTVGDTVWFARHITGPSFFKFQDGTDFKQVPDITAKFATTTIKHGVIILKYIGTDDKLYQIYSEDMGENWLEDWPYGSDGP